MVVVAVPLLVLLVTFMYVEINVLIFGQKYFWHNYEIGNELGFLLACLGIFYAEPFWERLKMGQIFTTFSFLFFFFSSERAGQIQIHVTPKRIFFFCLFVSPVCLSVCPAVTTFYRYSNSVERYL